MRSNMKYYSAYKLLRGGGRLLLWFVANACGWTGCGELHKMQ